MATLLMVLVLLLNIEHVFSQNDDDYANLLMGMFCGRNPIRSQTNFIKNRNTTLNDLRMQLLTKRVVYARAQALDDGDSVFAVAQCRNYQSADKCVACFDAGVYQLLNCTAANGYVSFDNCFIRYEDFPNFYNTPYFQMDGIGLQYLSCDNHSASDGTIFSQVVDGLLSDIKDATPKTSNLYVASKRDIISDNTTVYAVGQCIQHIDQSICLTCMSTAYDKLNDCLPSNQGRFSDMACFARYSQTSFFNDSQTIDIKNLLKGHSSKLVAIVVASIGGLILVFFILGMWLWCRPRKSKPTESGAKDLNKPVVYYSCKDLKLAINNFSKDNILGKGGFGEVYKATLHEKEIVAVKKLQVKHAGTKEEFENEIKLISKIQHRNLLRLLGWSSEESHLLLVLEYMSNGSLDQFLWGARRGALNWNQRYEIIIGIARGLAHLHNELHVKIVHRDVKSSNILLTDDFRPKIADFGLARFQPEDQSHVSTEFAGTLGYTAPEYALQGFLSDKVDTYSFGIVILEIISGRKSTEMTSSACCLLDIAWEMYEKTTHTSVIDETLSLNEYERENATKIIEIALLCTQTQASERPPMSEVVSMLQDIRSVCKRELSRPNFLWNQDRRVGISIRK